MNILELIAVPDVSNVYVELKDGKEYVSIKRTSDGEISIGTERTNDMNFASDLVDNEGNSHEVDGIQYGTWEDQCLIQIDTDDILVEPDGKEYAKISDFWGTRPIRRP